MCSAASDRLSLRPRAHPPPPFARIGVAPMLVSAIDGPAIVAVVAVHERRDADRRPVLRAPVQLEVRPAGRTRRASARGSRSASPPPRRAVSKTPRKKSAAEMDALAGRARGSSSRRRVRASPPADPTRDRRGRASRRSSRGDAPADRRSSPRSSRRSGSAPARAGRHEPPCVASARRSRAAGRRPAHTRARPAARCRSSFDGRAMRSLSAGISECPPASSFASLVRAEQLDRMIDALGTLVVERCGDHCFASWIARQTRSGVAGIWTSVTPRWDRASTTAFITAAPDAIVPVSPTPLTPSGFVGLGVVDESSSNDGSSTADGTRYVTRLAVCRLPVLVVAAFLVEGGGDTLRDAAVDLPFDDQRIDHRADVVDRDVADETRIAGLGVHLDHRCMGTAGPARSSAGRTRPWPRGRAPCRPEGCARRTPPTTPP